MLRDFIIQQLQEYGCFENVIFMQNGAIPHIDCRIKQLRMQHFTNAKMNSHIKYGFAIAEHFLLWWRTCCSLLTLLYSLTFIKHRKNCMWIIARFLKNFFPAKMWMSSFEISVVQILFNFRTDSRGLSCKKLTRISWWLYIFGKLFRPLT